jgi:acyl carrier protein
MTSQFTSERLVALVRSLLAEIVETPVQMISVDANIAEELDLDSLQQLELMTMVERRLDVRLDVEDWLNSHNILELAERVRLRLEQSTSE